MNKRGQFFILAAVILSALIFGLGMTINKVVIKQESTNFYDYSNIINNEANQVLDYQVFSGVNNNELESFVKNLSDDMKDKNPHMNFLFIYGNTTKIKIKNLGVEKIKVADAILNGKSTEIESKIKVNLGSISIINDNAFSDAYTTLTLENPGDNLVITFNENDYKFSITSYNQVIFIIQKNEGEEIYVDVK